MRKITIILLSALMFAACGNKGDQKKALLDSVLAVHDKVMGAEDQMMKNKHLLDTILQKNDPSSKDTASLLIKKIALADSAMDNWMHNFDYEQKGKPEEETIRYMELQKKAIMAIDSQLNKVVDESNKFLAKTKSK
jgi:hypothetical protein